MSFNFSWVVPGHLAGMGRPGCALELSGEMLPHEQRFLSWLNASRSLSADRDQLGSDIGSVDVERRMLAIYRKFRDPWRVLESFREGFGETGASVDRFVKDDARALEDLAYVKAQGIADLVTLTERPLPPEWLETAQAEALHLPVVDGGVPEPGQLRQFVDHLDKRLGASDPSWSTASEGLDARVRFWPSTSFTAAPRLMTRSEKCTVSARPRSRTKRRRWLSKHSRKVNYEL